MNVTLSPADLFAVIAVVLILAFGSRVYFSGPTPQQLRMQRQLDAIMKHLDLPEPQVSRPGALSAPVAALADAGRKIDAMRLYRQETGASLREAKAAIELGTATKRQLRGDARHRL
jgi:hypothetical protein